jgi:hypothetical protein
MFTKVLTNQTQPIGTILSYDSTHQDWRVSPSGNTLFGVVEENEEINEMGEFWVTLRLGGIAYALSDRPIPDEGGFLKVTNGKVYADITSDSHQGIVAPVARGGETRSSDELILVYLR